MDARALLIMVLFVTITAARPMFLLRSPPCSCPQKQVYITKVATPCVETIDYVYQPPCSEPKTCGPLILPPSTVELPVGLGYFPAALPIVAQSFKPGVDCLTTGAYLPVSQPCDSLILAAPVCPEWAPLVKPIIL